MNTNHKEYDISDQYSANVLAYRIIDPLLDTWRKVKSKYTTISNKNYGN